ncbi:MAG: acetylornithine deacetylase/succinyl-diaminopimelate desuccinylase-like protein [Gammaproteobacteria bacterium]|jgi:acetylornithine deacetylase/succinyl-diaminopimelate desuccinylase-like protein
MDIKKNNEFCDQRWDASIIPELIEYIKLPNKSPMFDPDWQKNGYMDQVVDQFTTWTKKQEINGLQLEVVRLENRTPLIFIEISGQASSGEADNTLLLYGHLDKQPEMSGWREGLGPWTPVLDGDKLYGRGGADDGYALFSCLTAIETLQKQAIPHARCVIIIEACEESGSPDLPFYMDALSDRIGTPNLVICLDSGCGNYEQLWCTTSLRGLIGGVLTVEVLDEGVHSGDSSGIVPCSFRILRQLLDRIENASTGLITDNSFNVDIPDKRLKQAKNAASMMSDEIFNRFPFKRHEQTQTQAVHNDPAELILNRSWRPALTVVGADGIPDIQSAGNVMRPITSVKLSMRLPPTCDADVASQKLKSILEENPPYQANITFTPDWAATGWMAPEIDPWLEAAIDKASMNFFNKPAVHIGEGWSIPFMGMLGEKFPDAQFLITGVLGPGSNAHGPNEFLHIPMVKKLTACIASVIADHFNQ